MTVETQRDFVFSLGYPRPGEPLYSNVHAATGSCSHRERPVEDLQLHVDGTRVSRAVLGLPPPDAAPAGARPHVRRSGFACYFPRAELPRGASTFEFHVRSGDERAVFRRVVRGADGPPRLKLTDVFVDIVGPCNLRCTLCPQGRLEGGLPERPHGIMPVELFERVLSTLAEQRVLGEYVNLYNWGDPLLHPHLDEILDVCRARGVKAILSTNLSFPARRVDDLRAGPVELLLVSVSGFTQATYAVNHVGGDLGAVLRNLERLAVDRGGIRELVLKFLVFDHNRHELAAAKCFCDERGIGFGAYPGAIPSADSFFRYSSDAEYRRTVHDLLRPEQIELVPTLFCPQETSITLNHRAELERCCVSWSGGVTRSLFEADLRGYLDHKVENDFCARCLSGGYSYYKHFGVLSPRWTAEASSSSRE